MSQTNTRNSASQGNFFFDLEEAYRLFWIFLIGSVIGFLLETLWCLGKYGTLESRSCLLFLPMTVVYGFGALTLYLSLRNVTPDKTLRIFAYGAIGGTVVEYLISFLQESLFGSVSWDYAHAFLNINGRVCLTMSLIWGLLSLVWAGKLQPALLRLIGSIPAHIYKPLSHILFVVVLLSAVVSCAAVSRWSLRLEGVPAMDIISSALDSLLPDEKMLLLYPNMTF